MCTMIDLMLAIRDRFPVWYHKDTNQFDHYPVSETELKKLDPNAHLPRKDFNNFMLPTYKEIDHKEIMRFYVRKFK